MKTKYLLKILTVILAAQGLQADVLKLKTGPAVQGTLVSANSREVLFLAVDGSQRTYPLTRVDSITFAPLPPPPPPPPPLRSFQVATYLDSRVM